MRSTMYLYNKGSEWRRWDLHVHTKGTNKNDQFKSDTFEMFCKNLFRAAIDNEIAAIGITDYFSIENYCKVIDYVKAIKYNTDFSPHEQNLIEKILILPNVELRMLPVAGAKRLINIHCIFNPNYISYLENDFFNSLECSYGDKPYKMNRNGIIALGRALGEKGDDAIAYKKGVDNLTLAPKDLRDLLKSNKELANNTIVVVSNSNQDGISGVQKHYDLFENEPGSLEAIRDSVYQISDCIFSSNEKDIKYFLGESIDSPEKVCQKCKSLKPCIHGCDAHTEDKLFKPDNNRYCWIKADCSFEGLKQILCEPKERVKIQEFKPEKKFLYNIIEKIKFIDTSGECKFPNYEIGFNPGLNAIIGGKSSGKSLLLHMIANEIGDKTDLKDYSDLLSGVKIEVYYADDLENCKTATDKRVIEFLPQLYIERIVRDRIVSDKKKVKVRYFDTFIEGLIKQNDEIKDIFNKHNVTIQQANSDINLSIDEWLKLDDSLNKAKNDLRPLGDKKAIENEISKRETEKEILTKSSGLSDDEMKEYKRLIELNENINKEINSINRKQTELNRLDDFVKSISTNIKDSIHFQTEDTIITTLFSQMKEEIVQSINEIVSQYNIKIKEQNTYFVTEQEKLKENYLVNTNLLKPFLDKMKIEKEISNIDSIIKSEKDKLKLILDKEAEIYELRKKIDDIDFITPYTTIFNSYNAIQTSINQKITEEWDETETKIKISVNTNFDETAFVNSLSSSINMKTYLENQFENSGFGEGSKYNYRFDTHISNIKNILYKCVSENNRFNNFKADHDTEELLRSLLKDYFFMSYDIFKGSDSLQNMSEGKKGIVILQLYLSLSKSDCPILIDQPEDNLDNRTVYTELNDYIKHCKQRRQIIMVSHNANLVVNTDAENIIVANQSGEDGKDNNKFRFEYINGPLENTFSKDVKQKGILYQQGIREHVCEILEGGTEAFKKREEKYNIKS